MTVSRSVGAPSSTLAAARIARILLLLLAILLALSCAKEADGRKRIALTFDDGPNDPYTTGILAALAEQQARATFFVVGERVAGAPATVAAMSLAGHEVANHTYSHLRLTHVPFDEATADVLKGEQAVAGATGIRPSLLRCPADDCPAGLDEWCRAHGCQLVSANVWGMDWELNSAQEVAQRVLDRAYDGAIILLHDGRYADEAGGSADRSVTVEATRLIVAGLKSEDYELVTVSELK